MFYYACFRKIKWFAGLSSNTQYFFLFGNVKLLLRSLFFEVLFIQLEILFLKLIVNFYYLSDSSGSLQSSYYSSTSKNVSTTFCQNFEDPQETSQ